MGDEVKALGRENRLNEGEDDCLEAEDEVAGRGVESKMDHRGTVAEVGSSSSCDV